MAFTERVVKGVKNVPFFLIIAGGVDQAGLASSSIITTQSVPTSVSDTKEINWSEIQIPGGHTSSTRFGSFGNNTIAFSLKVADFNNKLGVTSMTSALSNLRRPTSSFDVAAKSFFKPFVPPPKVIMWHSAISTVPLFYIVKKCDFDTSNPNILGRPQVVTISFQFILHEDGALYRAEVAAAKALGLVNVVKNIKRVVGKGNPYRKDLFL